MAKPATSKKPAAKKPAAKAKPAAKKNAKAAKKPAAAKKAKKAPVAKAKAKAPKKAAKKPACVVVGSCFMDYVGYCERTPVGGETVHSSSFQKGFGGKGANQAYMVARHAKGRAVVKMVSAVGKDGDGAAYVANLKKAGVDTACVQQVPKESTGLAMISVSTATGQNQIVICPNATNKLVDVDFKKSLGPAPGPDAANPNPTSNDILVVQNEIPIATTVAALREAKRRGMTTIFNPAPAPSTLEVAKILPVMDCVDVFCPNETEAALLTGLAGANIAVTKANAEMVCTRLLSMGAKKVVMTMGSQGYCVASASPKTFAFYPARVAETVVDTTGAGDCFVGAMVSSLLKGKPLEDACAAANIAACISVQRKGTQTSFPTAAEAEAFAKKL